MTNGSLMQIKGEPSLQAKGTKSTSFLTCIRNEVDLVPLANEDEGEHSAILLTCIKR